MLRHPGAALDARHATLLRASGAIRPEKNSSGPPATMFRRSGTGQGPALNAETRRADMIFDVDVVVVGAGPTGLLLAGDLARAGLSCALFERRPERSGLTRAFAVHARTLELLDARGVADELVATGQRVGAVQVFGRVQVDLSRLPSRFPFVLITPQYETERVLEERARALGAEIVGGAEVVGLRQDADGVELDVRARDG